MMNSSRNELEFQKAKAPGSAQQRANSRASRPFILRQGMIRFGLAKTEFGKKESPLTSDNARWSKGIPAVHRSECVPALIFILQWAL
jgi:hypothetical protein